MLPLTILIIDKGCNLKNIAVKDYKEEDLYKKCGFKKNDGFKKQVEWTVKMDGNNYTITMYGKIEGRANTENKYDFPPPIDTKLYFGSCALVATMNQTLYNLSIPLWNKLYENLFGGFEDLSSTAIDDEKEIDELESIPNSKKTKTGGYLKDGFVVDDSSTDDEMLDQYANGSELSEEEYDYSD